MLSRGRFVIPGSWTGTTMVSVAELRVNCIPPRRGAHGGHQGHGRPQSTNWRLSSYNIDYGTGETTISARTRLVKASFEETGRCATWSAPARCQPLPTGLLAKFSSLTTGETRGGTPELGDGGRPISYAGGWD